jgi:hypothetical protein
LLNHVSAEALGFVARRLSADPLVLRGEAGVGKSALLDYLSARSAAGKSRPPWRPTCSWWD